MSNTSNWMPRIVTKQGVFTYLNGRVYIDRRDGNGFVPCLSEQEKQEIMAKVNPSVLSSVN
jgi:hypothetical protein